MFEEFVVRYCVLYPAVKKNADYKDDYKKAAQVRVLTTVSVALILHETASDWLRTPTEKHCLVDFSKK